MIKTHLGFISFWGVKSVSACHVTPHFSREFTNGSSSDATGNNNWRFQAENLRQITIYQLMKPLKIIPYPPVPTVLAAALLKRALAALRGAAPAWLTTSLRSRYIPEDSSRENTNSDTDSKWSWNNFAKYDVEILSQQHMRMVSEKIKTTVLTLGGVYLG